MPVSGTRRLGDVAGEMLIDQGDTTDASAHTTTSKVDAGGGA